MVLWSALSRIGRTTPMRLTAIIPLLGVLLIFNETIASSLVLAPQFISDIGQSADNDFSFSTLYFTYFGLCALGFGSIIFSLACPSDIQTQPNQLDFVASTPIGDSKNLAKSYLRYIINAFANAKDHNYEDETHIPVNYSYPSSLEGEMGGLLEELYLAAGFDNIDDEDGSGDPGVSNDSSGDENESDDGDLPDFMEVMNGAGYLDFTHFGIAMASGARVYFSYTVPFYNQAPNFSRDIAFLKYRTDDFSRFSLRILTTILYGFGFFLLSIPTIRTFFLLSKNALTWLY